MQAQEILTTAAELVTGRRQEQHGDKAKNLTATAEILNGYLRARELSGRPLILEAHEMADIMELVKIARRLNGEANLDDYIDGAGYAAIAGELRGA